MEDLGIRLSGVAEDAGRLETFVSEADVSSIAKLEAAVNAGDAFCALAELFSDIIGWVVVHTNYRPDYGWAVDEYTRQLQSGGNAYLELISVVPSYRRSGVGGKLLQAADRSALAAGKSQLWLHVATENLAAVTFYERHLWERERTVWPIWRKGGCMYQYRKALA